MYSDEDLNHAVTTGIFSAEAVEKFRARVNSRHNTVAVDEENFRLIGGFNDIFVVIACALLLISSSWLLRGVNEIVGALIVPVLSWGLAEFFILRKKMALPAIVLLLSYVGGIFFLVMQLLAGYEQSASAFAAALSAIAAYAHWRRFKVPITVAACTAAAIGFLISALFYAYPGAQDGLLGLLFVCGVAAFVYAMYWDGSDRRRETRRSDVAFWLHLLAAPLMIHPVFAGLGILEGSESMVNMGIIIGLYILMTLISLAIDRRAFMVSSLFYVLYALSSLFEAYGAVSYSFALTGVVIGSALLLLAAFWHSSRSKLVALLSPSIQRYLPAVTG